MTVHIPANLYSLFYYLIIATLSFVTVFYYVNSPGQKIIRLTSAKSTLSLIFAMGLAAFLILFIGYRPVSGVFVDMPMYSHSYNNVYNDYVPIDFSTEWLWTNIAFFCKDIGMSTEDYFAICEVLYILPLYLACQLLMPKNVWPAFLICIASFSFFSYGVNGIRNGVACSMAFLSVALLTQSKYHKIVAIILMFAAFNIHHSTALPILCATVSLFMIKEPKQAIVFWVASIILSLLVGNIVGDIFAGIGFDDRTHYFEAAEEGDAASQFSSTGFRFDFLLYSAMPVLLTWYLTVKRNFQDSTFNIIANTYILANAFWVVIIRAEFSNRFAYLSWFLYPLVIAYPLIRFNIWENQDRKAALILLAYSGFTLFMRFVYYG